MSWIAFMDLVAAVLSGCELVSSLSPPGFEDGVLLREDAFCAESEAVATDGQAARPEILERIHVDHG